MPAKVLRSIRGQAQMGSANAYGEVEMNLALSLESRFLYYVTSLQVRIDSPAQPDDDFIWQWHVARATKSAVENLTDNDIIWAGGWGIITTTSGAAQFPHVERVELTHPYAIASPSLFLGVDTQGAAAACNCSVELMYYPEKVSQTQFWEASQTR